MTSRILHFAWNKNLDFSANNESLSGKFDQEMKRNVKDTYNIPNDPVGEPSRQIWWEGWRGGVGWGIQPDPKIRGRVVLKKISALWASK